MQNCLHHHLPPGEQAGEKAPHLPAPAVTAGTGVGGAGVHRSPTPKGELSLYRGGKWGDPVDWAPIKHGEQDQIRLLENKLCLSDRACGERPQPMSPVPQHHSRTKQPGKLLPIVSAHVSKLCPSPERIDHGLSSAGYRTSKSCSIPLDCTFGFFLYFSIHGGSK